MEASKRIDISTPVPGEPKLRIDCFGKYLAVYVGSLLIGKGVKALEFRHEAERAATLKIECDVEHLGFYIVEQKESVSDALPSETEI